MKNLILVLTITIVALFSSCNILPTAQCHLIMENKDVVVDNTALKNFNEGDTILLESRFVTGSEWEVASTVDYKKIATLKDFPNDTIYTFTSAAGRYSVVVEKAILVKKL